MIKNLLVNAGDKRNVGFKKSPGGGHGKSLQFSCLENPMDRGAYGLQFIGSQRVGQDWSDSAPYIISLLTPKGANSTPTQILLLMWITLFNCWLLKKVKLFSPQISNAKQLLSMFQLTEHLLHTLPYFATNVQNQVDSFS